MYFVSSRTRTLLVAIAVLLLSTYIGMAKPTIDAPQPALAIVNGDTISAKKLTVELVRIHSGQHDTSRVDFSVEKLVTKMVNDRLIIQDAKLLQLDADSSFQKSVDSYNLRTAIDQYTLVALPDTVQIPDDDIRTYYDEQYRQVHLFRLVARDQLQADSITTALHRGSTLEAEAAKYSAEMYRYGGGDLGFRWWVSVDKIIQDHLKSAKIGEVVGPFPFQSGYAFTKCLETTPADTAQFKTYRGQIINVLKQRKLQGYRQAYFESIKKQYSIFVDEKLLNDLIISRDTKPNELKNADSVVARVNTDSITVKNLNNKVLHQSAGMTTEMMTGLKSGVLEELIENKLLKLEALAHDYKSNSGVLEITGEYADSLLLMRYIGEVIDPQIMVSPTAIDSFYQANRLLFRKSGAVKFSQITTTTKDSSLLLLERFKQGSDFAWLAKQYSIDDASIKGGDKGWVNLSSFPSSIKDTLAITQFGQVIGPYESMEGFVILKLEDRKEGDIYELEAVRGRIKKILEQVEFDRIMNFTLEQLKKNSVIKIDHEAINKLVLGVKRGK